MAKTLLDSVNEVMRRTGIIAGDSGVLTSLTDSPRQVFIDQARQVINEGVDELYSSSPLAMPNELKEGSFNLSTGVRAYSLAADLSILRWPIIDRINNQFILHFVGGYEGLLILDPEQDDTGLPQVGVIRPTDGQLFLDRAPTIAQNGRQYFYQYEKQLGMTLATDTVPFDNDVWRAMVPAWVQLFKRELRGEFDRQLYGLSIGRAARLMIKTPARTHYSRRF